MTLSCSGRLTDHAVMVGANFEWLSVELPDGRRLEVHVAEASEALPLIFHHGTPGSGLSLPVMDAAARRHGLRWLGITRPGFGGSTRQPGRRVADIGSDVAAVLDHLGIERCVVAGWSGGGPHALACGALLADRVAGVLVIAGCAPYPAEGLDWFAGMSQDEADEAAAAIAGREDLRSMLEPRASWYRTATGADLVARVTGRFSPVDAAALTANADDFLANLREGVRVGIDGWLDDWHAFVHPWGFDVEDVTVPTILEYGNHDSSCPIAHCEWMRTRIPNAVAHIEPDEGHISVGLNVIDRMLEHLAHTGRS